MKFCEVKKVAHIEVNSKSSIDIKESFDMLIKSIIKDKTKEQLIKLYGWSFKDKKCKSLKKKRIFSRFDKYICF